MLQLTFTCAAYTVHPTIFWLVDGNLEAVVAQLLLVGYLKSGLRSHCAKVVAHVDRMGSITLRTLDFTPPDRGFFEV